MWFIAAGGIETGNGDAHLFRVRAELPGDLPGLLLMRWEDLRDEVDRRRATSELSPEASAVLTDMAMALETWGYRRKIWFSSLPTVAARLRAEEAMPALRAWRVR